MLDSVNYNTSCKLALTREIDNANEKIDDSIEDENSSNKSKNGKKKVYPCFRIEASFFLGIILEVKPKEIERDERY